MDQNCFLSFTHNEPLDWDTLAKLSKHKSLKLFSLYFIFNNSMNCEIATGYLHKWGFPDGSVINNLSANSGDAGNMQMQEMQGLIPRLKKFPGGGNSNPLQYFCLKKSYGLQSQTRLNY